MSEVKGHEGGEIGTQEEQVDVGSSKGVENVAKDEGEVKDADTEADNKTEDEEKRKEATVAGEASVPKQSASLTGGDEEASATQASPVETVSQAAEERKEDSSALADEDEKIESKQEEDKETERSDADVQRSGDIKGTTDDSSVVKQEAEKLGEKAQPDSPTEEEAQQETTQAANSAHVEPAATEASIPAPTSSEAPERELPGPPTPLKGEEPLPARPAEDEVAIVAKAFGVKANVSEGQSSLDEAASKQGAEAGSEARTVAERPPSTDDVPAPVPKTGGIRIGKGPPPTTQASEERPFDFNRFLDQMRHRSAGPVGEYVRSFIKGFTKKPYRVADQTKLIFDFLDFIALRMRECDVWATLSQSEFENAMEAMEKLIMNRLYNYTFSPAIKREGKWSVQTDDLERDRVLKQRIRLFGWIDETHLDVPIGDHSKGFVDFAIQELLKINHYKAPRDKVICILNCCKVIFGLIRHLSSQENADTFVPILIFVVLRANPDNLISNVEYISRFRNPERLSSESGYYLSSLMGAIAFIETMDYTSLSNITQQQFEANVESAVQTISAQGETIEAISPARSEGGFNVGNESMSSIMGGDADGQRKESGSTLMTPQGSSSSNEDGGRTLPISTGAAALAKDTRAFIQRTGEAARVGIGASFGGGMSALGRLFQDGLDGPRTPLGSSPGAVEGSGYSTPDTSAGQANATQSSVGSARARMWNLFGVDEDQKDQLAIKNKEGSGRAGRSSSGPSLNFGSWGRNMRIDADSEPPTPQSDELQQGRFSALGGGVQQPQQPQQQQKQQQQGRLLSERLARSFENRPPHTPLQVPRQPIRRDSTDPYMVEGGSGVQTPTDDGSDVGEEEFQRRRIQTFQTSPDARGPEPASDAGEGIGISRSRPSELSSYLPSFLSDVGLVRSPLSGRTATPNTAATVTGPQDGQIFAASQQQALRPGPAAARLDDEQAAEAAAQIDRAHVDAGVGTLKSIFPDTDDSVCRLVLEGCGGNVQAAIDKLLEMA